MWPKGRGRFARGGALAVALLLTMLAQVAGALSYYKAEPQGTVGVSRPSISQQIVLGPGETISQARMWLDGAEVQPVWDSSGLVKFTPAGALIPGTHTVKLSVQVTTTRAGYVYDPIASDFSFTVEAGAVQIVPGPGPEERRALQQVNRHRNAAGLPALSYSPALGAASSGHARYLIANPGQREADPHHERSGTPYFFGASGLDRARYFGYSGGTGEVINFVDRAEDAVDGWMDTLYHRIPLIHPGMKEMGYGLAGNGKGLVNVILSGPSDETGGTVLWPNPGQSNVPVGWDGLESPDPFASHPGVTGPVGYTITMTFGGRPRSLVLRSASLTGPGGPVMLFSYDPRSDSHLTDTVALIPRYPLVPATTYSVRMTGEVDLGNGVQPFDKSWSFTTAAEPHPDLDKRVVTTANGLVRSIAVDGSGFTQGSTVFLGGLPVEGLTVQSATRISFAPPVGYAGGLADLVVANRSGTEARWSGFFNGEESMRFPQQGPAYKNEPLQIHGRTSNTPALVGHNGSIYLPEGTLADLGFEKVVVDPIGRSYWTMRELSGDYTLGRLTTTVNGKTVKLSQPVTRVGSTTYIDASFVHQMAPGMVKLSAGSASVGLGDIGTYWGRDSVISLMKVGIVSGMGDGTFGPNNTLSRAAFARMLVSARGIDLQPGEAGGFADTAGHWAAQQGYLGAAVRSGILVAKEYPSGRFEPDRAITREEMAVMVARSLGLESQARSTFVSVVGGVALIGGRRFIDAGDWRFRGHIALAVERGIISGYAEPDGRFTYRPDRTATRGEATVMILRSMQ